MRHPQAHVTWSQLKKTLLEYTHKASQYPEIFTTFAPQLGHTGYCSSSIADNRSALRLYMRTLKSWSVIWFAVEVCSSRLSRCTRSVQDSPCSAIKEVSTTKQGTRSLHRPDDTHHDTVDSSYTNNSDTRFVRHAVRWPRCRPRDTWDSRLMYRSIGTEDLQRIPISSMAFSALFTLKCPQRSYSSALSTRCTIASGIGVSHAAQLHVRVRLRTATTTHIKYVLSTSVSVMRARAYAAKQSTQNW
jgi:hypothetical protein